MAEPAGICSVNCVNSSMLMVRLANHLVQTMRLYLPAASLRPDCSSRASFHHTTFGREWRVARIPRCLAPGDHSRLRSPLCLAASVVNFPHISAGAAVNPNRTPLQRWQGTEARGARGCTRSHGEPSDTECLVPRAPR